MDFDERDQESAMVLSDWAAIAIDNARLYTSLQSRHGELERAVRGLEATAVIARSVGAETDLERVLELVVKRGRALLGGALPGGGARAGRTRAGRGRGRRGRCRARRARACDDRHGRRVRAERGRLGAHRRSGQPGGARAWRARARGDGGVGRAAVVSCRHARSPDRVRPSQRVVRRFDADDEHILSSFAASAAIAIATAQSVEDDRRRNSVEASEQERRRWARELHDETLQELGALKVRLEGARQSERPEAIVGRRRPGDRADPALDQRAPGADHGAAPGGARRAGDRTGAGRADQAHRRHLRARHRGADRPRVRAGAQPGTARAGARERHLPDRPGVAHERDQARRGGARRDSGCRGRPGDGVGARRRARVRPEPAC